MSEFPGNSGSRFKSSPKMHPTAQMSTPAPYAREPGAGGERRAAGDAAVRLGAQRARAVEVMLNAWPDVTTASRNTGR